MKYTGLQTHYDHCFVANQFLAVSTCQGTICQVSKPWNGRRGYFALSITSIQKLPPAISTGTHLVIHSYSCPALYPFVRVNVYASMIPVLI